ncbi:hypothetical protein C8R45DRAFT_1097471 [Mycena sanguinolenta]|nr:hypothetical protein C8R45DRAFT_1097471 [Mycena sanguinolenta]
MHINTHKLACQLLYSLNLIFGSTQVDAEGIERAWAGIRGVATSTRNMGPGSRHDVLDCQFSYWNWQKLVSIVELLRRRMDRAKEELKEQTEAFEEFSAQQAERVPQWRQMVLEYEQDETKKNPYQVEVKGFTEAKVRLQLTKEEADEAAWGVLSMHDVSASSFISTDLDLEQEQRRVRVQAELKKAGTMGMDLAAMSLQVLGDMALPSTTLAEDVPLLLPSVLTDVQHTQYSDGMDHIEALMRDAQCCTSLTRLRNQLHIKSHLLTYKKNHVRHQGANTRSRTIVMRNESKIRRHSKKYQMAWQALRVLNGGEDEMVGWKVLKKDDIRCMEDAEDLWKKAKEQAACKAKWRERNLILRTDGLLSAEEDDDMDGEDTGTGQGPENQRQMSWIWAVAGTEGTDAGLENGGFVRSFCNVGWTAEAAQIYVWNGQRLSLAHGAGYEEETWQKRAAAVPVGVIPHADAEAAVAYALRHADMYHDLRDRGIKRWNEEKLTRGKKWGHYVPAVISTMEMAMAAKT